MGDIYMKIENLRHFLALARTGNMKWAAEEQFLTRQNLNIIIKNIEAELNIPLFTRTNKGTVLNQDGEAFVKTAQQIVDVYDAFLKERQPQSSMFLEIYTTPTLGNIVKSIIEDVMKEGCYLSVREHNFNELSSMITNNQSGIYLVPLYDRDKLKHLAERKNKILLTCDDAIVTICHKSHPLAETIVNEQDISKYPIIVTGFKTNVDALWSIPDIAICKKIMKQNHALYQSSSFLFKYYFSAEDEWKVIDVIKNQKIEITLFLNISDKQQMKLFDTILMPKLRNIFNS